jgi:hypothetical protein
MKFVGMTDMDLQQKCVEAGAIYVREMFPNLDDVEKRAHLQNAVAAGYSKGWRDKENQLEERESKE